MWLELYALGVFCAALGTLAYLVFDTEMEAPDWAWWLLIAIFWPAALLIKMYKRL